MGQDEFCKTFIELTEKLDRFFHLKLHGTKIRTGIEEQKRDLLQDTAVAVLEKLEDEKYARYPLETLIWIKAKDVWLEYSRRNSRIRYLQLPPDLLDNRKSDTNIFVSMENAEQLHQLQESLRITDWNMVYMQAAGYRIREISELAGKSPGAIKMKISRIRKNIRPDKSGEV